MKNKVNAEQINEGEWAKQQFETKFKKELETAGFKIIKGSGKWGKSNKIVVRDKKGFDRMASGENGEIGYSFIAECVRLLDRRNAVLELETLYPQMALLGWHCDPVFDMVKSFNFIMHDGTERSVALTQLGIHKLAEELEIRAREVKVVEIYPQIAGLGWDVDFSTHTIRMEDDNHGYGIEGKKYIVYDYWKEDDFEELMSQYNKFAEMME